MARKITFYTVQIEFNGNTKITVNKGMFTNYVTRYEESCQAKRDATSSKNAVFRLKSKYNWESVLIQDSSTGFADDQTQLSSKRIELVHKIRTSIGQCNHSFLRNTTARSGIIRTFILNINDFYFQLLMNLNFSNLKIPWKQCGNSHTITERRRRFTESNNSHEQFSDILSIISAIVE